MHTCLPSYSSEHNVQRRAGSETYTGRRIEEEIFREVLCRTFLPPLRAGTREREVNAFVKRHLNINSCVQSSRAHLKNMEEVVVVLLLEQGLVLGVAPPTARATTAAVFTAEHDNATPKDKQQFNAARARKRKGEQEHGAEAERENKEEEVPSTGGEEGDAEDEEKEEGKKGRMVKRYVCLVDLYGVLIRLNLSVITTDLPRFLCSGA